MAVCGKEKLMTVKIVKSVCPKDCPDTCGMLSHVENGRVVRVTGDPDHPITRGFLCGRFQHYEELIYHPERLQHPLYRESKSAEFSRISWPEALQIIARRFQDIIASRGGAAILPYHYLANMGFVSSRSGDRLWNKLNTSRVGLEICAMAGAEAVIRIFGTIRGTEPQHLSKTRCYVAWGKNPKATNIHGHVMSKDIHPTIVVDPFRSESAKSADLFIQPRPASDPVLAMALMRILIERGWVDEEFLGAHTTGFDAVRERVMQMSLPAAADVCGVPAARIEEFAELYALNTPSLIHIGVGLQRNSNGGEMVAALATLAAMTGQVGVPGGGALYANFDWPMGDISAPELRREGPNFYNMIKLGEVLTADDAIQALYVFNSNPAATAPNQNKVLAGLARDDLFVVVHDLFMSDTAARANLVLPACTQAEQWDVHRSYWHDYAQINNPAIAPLGEARSNHWVFGQIAQAMGFDEPCFGESEVDTLRSLLAGTGIEFDALAAGPVPCLPLQQTSFDDRRFATPSGKLELIPPSYTPAASDGGHRYRFITPKSRHLQSSQLFNVTRNHAGVREASVYVHPEDAARDGIADGAPVRLWNARGEVELVARLSTDVQPGLVVSHMVRWGPNANATTPDAAADMGGNSTFHTNFVSLARIV
jgi:anaerobic selenocysteine-containing dehydrogenase